MSDEVKALLNKAKRSRKATKNLFDDGDIDFAASRAYYSLFYTQPLHFCSQKVFRFQAIQE